MKKFFRSAATPLVVAMVIIMAPALFGRAQPGVSSEITAVVKAATALKTVPVPNFPVEVPAQARPLLTDLKHSLRDLVTSEINSFPASNPSAIQAYLTNVLMRSDLLQHGEQVAKDYAQIHGVRVSQPPEHPNLLAAVTTLDIPCGQDSSLYIYRRAAHRWQLALAFEANDYPRIDGALGAFQYHVSPSDQDGHWFVVITDFTPWCSSTWHTLRLKVLRPSESAYHPKMILATSRFAYEGYDDLNKLAVTPDGFTLVYYAFQSLDSGVLIRTAVDKYNIVGDHATRTGPIGLYPEDFLDAWIGLPWEEAKQWTAPAARSSAKAWRQTLRQPNESQNGSFTNFDFVQSCSLPETWQVGLAHDTDPKAQGVPPEMYFTITQRHGVFRIQEVGIHRAPGCPGQAHPNRPIEPLPDPSTIR